MTENNQSKNSPDRVPLLTFKTRSAPEHPKTDSFVCPVFTKGELSTSEMFDGKKVVLFALPGAFTPTCSSTHLPGYEALYEDFKKLGIDEIYCLSVNDPFVMYYWGCDMQIKNVKLVADGSGLFTEAMGMLVAKDNLGFGKRSWRYSMYVVDGQIQKLFSEAGKEDNAQEDPFLVSDAKTMLDYLSALPVV